MVTQKNKDTSSDVVPTKKNQPSPQEKNQNVKVEKLVTENKELLKKSTKIGGTKLKNILSDYKILINKI